MYTVPSVAQVIEAGPLSDPFLCAHSSCLWFFFLLHVLSFFVPLRMEPPGPGISTPSSGSSLCAPAPFSQLPLLCWLESSFS